VVDDQRDLGAAEDDAVAAGGLEAGDELLEKRQRRRLEDAAHQLLHDDAVHLPFFLLVRTHDVDRVLRELFRVELAVDEPPRAGEPEAMETARVRLGGDDVGDVEPGKRTAALDARQRLMNRVVRTDENVRTHRLEFFRGDEHQLPDAVPVARVDAAHVFRQRMRVHRHLRMVPRVRTDRPIAERRALRGTGDDSDVQRHCLDHCRAGGRQFSLNHNRNFCCERGSCMKTLVTRLVLFVAICLFATPGLVLFAQENTEKKDDQKAAEKPKVSEEMVVTATKREEKIQDIPISVAAPSESDLRDRGAETIEDVAANVAGFTVQNLGPGQSQVAMRGVSSGQIVRDQPGVKEQVGVYLDESVISLSLFTPDIDLFDMNRVEVLRGPQGTLFGSGSESGTVRYITNQPRLNESETIGELTAEDVQDGSLGGSLKTAVNVPMGPTTAMRFVGYYTRFGGFIDAVQPNLSVKKDVNSGLRAGGRLSFLFKPNDKLTVTPRFLYQNLHMNGWNRIDVFNILGNPYTTTRPAVQLGTDRIFSQITEPTTDHFGLGDVNVSYDLGGGRTLSSITSYSNRNILVQRDAGALTSSITGGSIGLPPAVYTLNSPLLDATKAKGYTQELRVSGSSKQVQWLLGGFYAHNT